MATIEKITGKTGTTYRISVSAGFDTAGKRIRHRMTYKPEPGMTARQIQKAVQRAAADFERSIEQGYVLDNKQTFADYAAYVLDLKERDGTKAKTLDRYRELLIRINQAIGHIKLADLLPQHLNAFYKNLMEPWIRLGAGIATTKIDLAEWLKQNKKTRAGIAEAAEVAASTVSAAAQGKPIQEIKAKAIATAMGKKLGEVFTVEQNMEPLADKTILAYHRLISIILTQAEKEMLVPYNAAAKATPPKTAKKAPNYFQPETISEILKALEAEPLKWQLITHLLLVTGCRRGEIMGLKWDKVDFKNNRVTIDRALIVSPSKGVYESTTKTSDIRYLNLPAETMVLLKQHKREQLRIQIANGDRWIYTGYVFTQDNGDRMNPDSITAWLNDFSKRHGLPHINPHAFRHTVASVLLANGTDIVTVAAQLGHASANTTENFYAHIIEENKAKASECIADVLLRKKA
ncbi:MAG: site-specific integrase [Oscillospiraceae bacterium]|nr:site-specific integrase [Oscillospiraceae bacterium]